MRLAQLILRTTEKNLHDRQNIIILIFKRAKRVQPKAVVNHKFEQTLQFLNLNFSRRNTGIQGRRETVSGARI